MTDSLANRLNQILPRITDSSFLAGEGIGNEIACYIFDYPAEEELRVRDHIGVILEHLKSSHRELSVLHLDLFQVVTTYLKRRRLFDKALEMQSKKGDGAVLRALKGPLAAEKLKAFIAEEFEPNKHDLFLISGVGRVWPMMRVHALLNSLHTVMEQTTMVMFYPGTYDGTTLKLFSGRASSSDTLATDSYYRAFQLIPNETQA